jgi:hypothetical protein
MNKHTSFSLGDRLAHTYACTGDESEAPGFLLGRAREKKADGNDDYEHCNKSRQSAETLVERVPVKQGVNPAVSETKSALLFPKKDSKSILHGDQEYQHYGNVINMKRIHKNRLFVQLCVKNLRKITK